MHPGETLFSWFSKIPPGHATYIAHVYLMCTEKDMGPFFLEPEEVLGKFRSQITKDDFPVRIAARMVGAIATIDLILLCNGPNDGPPIGELATRYTNVVDMAGALWQKTIASWVTFCHESFSQQHIANWLRTLPKA